MGVGGMMQRLDKLRKYAFGAVAVFGSNNNSSISGVWCWRGQDLAFEKSEDLQIDYSSYKWTKLDSKSEDCKKKVEDYFRQQGQDSKGRDFCDGKIFKVRGLQEEGRGLLQAAGPGQQRQRFLRRKDLQSQRIARRRSRITSGSRARTAKAEISATERSSSNLLGEHLTIFFIDYRP